MSCRTYPGEKSSGKLGVNTGDSDRVSFPEMLFRIVFSGEPDRSHPMANRGIGHGARYARHRRCFGLGIVEFSGLQGGKSAWTAAAQCIPQALATVKDISEHRGRNTPQWAGERRHLARERAARSWHDVLYVQHGGRPSLALVGFRYAPRGAAVRVRDQHHH